MNFLFSDFLLISSGLFLLLRNIASSKRVLLDSNGLLIMRALFLVYTYNLIQPLLFAGFGLFYDIKYLIYIAFHCLLILIFLSMDISKDDLKSLLKSFIIAVLIASTLSLIYFLKGESLLSWSGGDFATSDEIPLTSLFRATFFYTGFHLYLGISILLLLHLISYKNLDTSIRFCLLSILIFEITVSLLFMNKTLFLAVPGAFILGIIYKYRFNFRLLFSKLLTFLFVIFSFFIIIATNLNSMFFDFFSKILHWDSLIIRLEVYFNSLNIIFNNFFPLIFGEGLGFLDSDDPRSMLYRTNSSGIIEGTVDSQYMNMLIVENIKLLVVHRSDIKDSENLTALDLDTMHLKFGLDFEEYHKIINRSGKVENALPEYWIEALFGFF